MTSNTENKCLTGKKQSPIEIISKNAIECSSLCKLLFFYRSSSCFANNNGKEFTIQYDKGSSVIFKDVVYELDTMSFTRPSSHKIDGKQYDAEIILYHNNRISNTRLAISIFIQLNDNNILSPTQTFLNEFINYIPTQSQSNKSIPVGSNWNMFDVLPEVKSFYTYEGSAIKGNCEENFTWIVMSNPVYTDLTFFDMIRKTFPNPNNRDTIKDDSRALNYNPNKDKSDNQNYGISMRCYDDKSFRSQCAIVSNNSQVQQQTNQMLYIIVALLSSILLLIGLYYLYINGYLNSLISGIKGGYIGIKEAIGSLYEMIINLFSRRT